MEIPLKGNIRDISLVKILVHLNRNRKTGTLTVSTSSALKNIYLKAGDVIFASSTYEDDRLGEMLLKAGKLTVEQYDKSVKILKTTGKRQGAILVELGYLTPKEIFQGLKYQVNEIIQSMFLLEDAQYEFREGDVPAREVITLKMSMGNLIYAGINRITHWTRIRNEMPDIESVLKISEDPLSLFQDVELSSQDKKMVSLIDGRKKIKEIIDSAWTSSFEALKILYVLWSIGIIEAAEIQVGTKRAEEDSLDEIFKPLSDEQETRSPAKIDSLFETLGTLTLNELLEVDWKADTETIRKNYYRLAKEYHPDRHLASADPDTKTKLTAIIEALNRAYHILKDDELRSEYYRSLVAPRRTVKSGSSRPEDLFREGTAELKKGNFSAAIGFFQTAVNLKPDSAQYLNYLSLAYSKAPDGMKKAEETLNRALKLEPFNADLHANLGLVYLKAGLEKKAQSSFQKALKIDPQHSRAKKGLEQIRG